MVTPHLPWKFHANRSSRFLVMLLTRKQRNKQTKKETKQRKKQTKKQTNKETDKQRNKQIAWKQYPSPYRGDVIMPTYYWYTSCELAIVECCRFAVRSLMIYVIISEILVLPVVDCHFGFSTRGSVGHDCWTFRCFVHYHKPMYWFCNDMCICKTSKVISTSGNLAATLDL